MLLSPYNNQAATTFLANDVALNNTSNFFNGPNTGSFGAANWVAKVTATASFADTAQTVVEAAIFNGSTYIADTTTLLFSTTQPVQRSTITLAPVVVTLSGATTFTLRAKNQNSTTGSLVTTGAAGGTTNVATWITVERLA